MTPIIENGALVTDLNGNGKKLLNPGKAEPLPAPFVDVNDGRLSNRRAPATGSVTDASVAWDAGITQDKLSLNGDIPADWLGESSTKAAKGANAEFLANKDQPGGYSGLDAGGKLDIAQLPSTGPEVGTVSEVKLSAPTELPVSGSPIIGAGTLSLTWDDAPAVSMLRGGDSPAPPVFNDSVMDISLIPNLDTSQFNTGTFILGVLPLAVGMGVGHAAGMVANPGDGKTGLDSDYLGRDMTWKRMETPMTYQPNCPNVQIEFQSVYRGQNYIKVFSPLKGSNLFLRIDGLTPTPELTANPTTVLVAAGVMLEAYASKAGYNNSAMAQYISPPIT